LFGRSIASAILRGILENGWWCLRCAVTSAIGRSGLPTCDNVSIQIAILIGVLG
jgi:hypothetical protein